VEMTGSGRLREIPGGRGFDAHADGFARAMVHLDRAATKELDKVDFDPRLRELVRIRASQLNGCAYCIDMHTKDARAIRETEQRIYPLPACRDTPCLTCTARAAARAPRGAEGGTAAPAPPLPRACPRGAGGEMSLHGEGGAGRPIFPQHPRNPLPRAAPHLGAGPLPALTAVKAISGSVL